MWGQYDMLVSSICDLSLCCHAEYRYDIQRNDKSDVELSWDVSFVNGLVQDCSNSIANTLKLLQSCTKPSLCLSWLFLRKFTEHHRVPL